jgi:hypothetical protein
MAKLNFLSLAAMATVFVFVSFVKNSICIGDSIVAPTNPSTPAIGITGNVPLDQMMLDLLALKKEMGLYIDNQNAISEEVKKLVNPVPKPRNFGKNNAQHKILLAIIDHGLDYNHPDTAANIHFQLDSHGNPFRLGKDFIGNDNWPAPYIGRTNPDRNRYELWVINQLTRHNPELNDYLDPRRSVLQEFISGAAHGQNVGGAMVAGRRDLGLLVYRYGPVNYEKGKSKTEYYGQAMGNIISSAAQAIADGARIIVIPVSFEEQIDADTHQKATENFEMWRHMCHRFKKLVLSAQERLFVVPLGNNDGQMVRRNSKTQFNFMAGIEAPNIVRVGAVNDQGEIAPFSNIATKNLDAVYVKGANIPTSAPTRMLVPPENYAQTYMSILNSIAEGNESYEGIGQVLLLFAKNTKQFSRTSGTSMSVGIYANLAAKIWADNPGLKVADVTRKIEERIESGKFMGYVQHKSEELGTLSKK